MNTGNFYFLMDDYSVDFPDRFLMKNKEVVNGSIHDRPCFYAFFECKTQIYWMIPFSSQLSKFQNEYQKKIVKYGRCDTIAFGNILGHQKAFLLQNMCPIIPRYIKNEYIDSNANTSVKLDGIFEKELIQKAKKVLSLTRQGKTLIFPDVLYIEKILIQEITTK